MAFLRNRQGTEKLPTIGLDEKDFIQAGIRYNLVFLGSMLVPTPIGHGSSRTANAVEKVYNEKYKAFGYGSRKVYLEISVDDLKIIETNGGNQTVVAKFQTNSLTYFNTDLKHDKAFVFVVSDEKDKSYRAYVFHCESRARAREVVIKVKEAFQTRQNKAEEMRLRTLSAPCRDLAKPRGQFDSGLVRHHEDEWGVFKGGTSHDFPSDIEENRLLNARQRSQTEIHNVNNLLLSGLESRSKNNGVPEEVTSHSKSSTQVGLDDADEFTELAEKRLRSFDDKALPNSGESFLLLDTRQTQPSSGFLQNQNVNSNKHEMENENLLQF